LLRAGTPTLPSGFTSTLAEPQLRSPSQTAQFPVRTKAAYEVSFKCACFSPAQGVYLAEVRLQEGEPLENALRRFKRKVQTEDIIKEVKRHSYYLKPGEKRRVKQALARKRAKKKIRKDFRSDRD
jgi:small subunit ribosomal protein S21